MKLLIDTSNRNIRNLTLIDAYDREVERLEGDEDLLLLFDRLIKRRNLHPENLIEVSARLEGESRVGIYIGVSAANALNYVLGLKSAGELKYPEN